jgi:HSP20 family protein
VSEPWWRRKRRKRSYPWFNIFEEFDNLDKMFDEMMRHAFEPFSGGSKGYKPYVYGFSVSIGPDGKPVIREFGNVRRDRSGPKIKEDREPLVDVLEEDEDVVVVAELPGVEKEDIKLHAAKDNLTISVDTSNRKYYKELDLPRGVDPGSARAVYKNGVLEVRLRKSLGNVFKGERISVE